MLLLAPFLAVAAVVYLYGDGLHDPRNAGRQIIAAAGCAIVTLFLHDWYRASFETGSKIRLRAITPTAIGLGSVWNDPRHTARLQRLFRLRRVRRLLRRIHLRAAQLARADLSGSRTGTRMARMDDIERACSGAA